MRQSLGMVHNRWIASPLTLFAKTRARHGQSTHWLQHGAMSHVLFGLLFLSGMPICVVLLPTAWWPWSLLLWFFGFVAIEMVIRSTETRWRGKPLRAGVTGVTIGIIISMAGTATTADAGADGGADGGSSDGGGGGD
jgi:uncharacterized membrane protein YgcG